MWQGAGRGERGGNEVRAGPGGKEQRGLTPRLGISGNLLLLCREWTAGGERGQEGGGWAAPGTWRSGDGAGPACRGGGRVWMPGLLAGRTCRTCLWVGRKLWGKRSVEEGAHVPGRADGEAHGGQGHTSPEA